MSRSQDLGNLFVKDLKRLKEEVILYQDQKLLWIKKGDIKNPAGNLALHICGNLQHFVGAVLGQSTYVRDRSFEFEGRVSHEELIKEIDITISTINDFFESFPVDKLDDIYPLEVFDHPMTNFYFLNHLHGHLNYHLGQINYHRRFI